MLIMILVLLLFRKVVIRYGKTYFVIFLRSHNLPQITPEIFMTTCRKYSNFKGGIPLQLAGKSFSSKHFQTLFPEILVWKK